MRFLGKLLTWFATSHRISNFITSNVCKMKKKSLMGSDLTHADMMRDMVSFEFVSYFNT